MTKEAISGFVVVSIAMGERRAKRAKHKRELKKRGKRGRGTQRGLCRAKAPGTPSFMPGEE